MTTTPVQPASLRGRVAEEVRVALTRRRMSATELAKRLGKSQTWIWRRLSGETAFDMDDLERVGAVLEVDPASFIPTGTFLGGEAVRSSSWLRSAAASTRAVARPPGRRDITRPGEGLFAAAA